MSREWELGRGVDRSEDPVVDLSRACMASRARFRRLLLWPLAVEEASLLVINREFRSVISIRAVRRYSLPQITNLLMTFEVLEDGGRGSNEDDNAGR